LRPSGVIFIALSAISEDPREAFQFSQSTENKNQSPSLHQETRLNKEENQIFFPLLQSNLIHCNFSTTQRNFSLNFFKKYMYSQILALGLKLPMTELIRSSLRFYRVVPSQLSGVHHELS